MKDQESLTQMVFVWVLHVNLSGVTPLNCLVDDNLENQRKEVTNSSDNYDLGRVLLRGGQKDAASVEECELFEVLKSFQLRFSLGTVSYLKLHSQRCI